MTRDELIDALLTWGDPHLMQERLHRSCGVSLRDASDADLRAVIEELEEQELEAGINFSWEYGDLSPFEYGGTHES